MRERIENTEPISPSGEGGPITVSTTFTAELGLHDLVMTIDVNGNITESQEDNNQFRTEIAILAPYVARIDIPSETTRIIPGNTSEVDIVLTGTGSRESDWSLSWTEYLNQGWSFSIDQQQSTTFTLQPNLPQIVSFSAFVPETALGDESGYVNLTPTNSRKYIHNLASNNTNRSFAYPEVFLLKVLKVSQNRRPMEDKALLPWVG